ncbi:MAG TPA: transketolase C-terminal domain-containing protein, partial [Gammaproteobacteria bacterium]|nr:transketolase C-terminal domain-containing protein [Gammaproteobacteria bacterium]
LGADEVAAARKFMGWTSEPFVIPDDVRAGWNAKARGAEVEAGWQKRFDAYAKAFPELAAEFRRRVAGELPTGWPEVVRKHIEQTSQMTNALATRQCSQASLNAYGPGLPELFGGSADLTPSNNTNRKDSRTLTGADPSGNYLHYGVREFGMAAIMNGIALHGSYIPYGGTFLVFSDYARNGMRMSALMKQRVIYVMTHDSIGLGEDGPTHQPIEHIPSLRIIPNMTLWRPCDSLETAVAWAHAIEHRDGPTVLALTRQALPAQTRSAAQVESVRRGGYVLKDCEGTPELILIATGSEVALAVEAAQALSGRRVRVVSMPCTSVFDAQDEAYREQVLPRAVEKRVAIEAAAPETWWRYVGSRGAVVGMHSFGASGVGKDLFKHFGFTVENVVKVVESILQAQK